MRRAYGSKSRIFSACISTNPRSIYIFANKLRKIIQTFQFNWFRMREKQTNLQINYSIVHFTIFVRICFRYAHTICLMNAITLARVGARTRYMRYMCVYVCVQCTHADLFNFFDLFYTKNILTIEPVVCTQTTPHILLIRYVYIGKIFLVFDFDWRNRRLNVTVGQREFIEFTIVFKWHVCEQWHGMAWHTIRLGDK